MFCRRLLAAVVVMTAGLLAGARPALAQFSYGFKAGLNRSTVTFDPALETIFAAAVYDSATPAATLGLAGGAVVRQSITERINIQIEGLFSQTAVSTRATYHEGSVLGVLDRSLRLHTIEVPVLGDISLGAGGRIHAQAGVVARFTIGRKEYFTQTLDGETTVDATITGDNQTRTRDLNFEFAIGGEFDVDDHVTAGGRFNIGLTNIRDAHDPTFTSITPRMLNFFVTYRWSSAYHAQTH